MLIVLWILLEILSEFGSLAAWDIVLKILKGLDKFGNAILSTKTSTEKENIEMLRLEVSSCQSEGSSECNLFNFWEKVVLSISVVIKILRNTKI